MQAAHIYNSFFGTSQRLGLPKPVAIYFAAISIFVLIHLIGSIGLGFGRTPENVAEGAAAGLLTVMRDDKNLESLGMFSSKDGINKEGTVEITGYQANWGGGLFGGGGLSAVGGQVVFHDFKHGGVTISAGTLDMRLSGIPGDTEQRANIKLQGQVQVAGETEPVALQIEFVSPKATYTVEKLSGKVKMNGQITTLNP